MNAKVRARLTYSSSSGRSAFMNLPVSSGQSHSIYRYASGAERHRQSLNIQPDLAPLGRTRGNTCPQKFKLCRPHGPPASVHSDTPRIIRSGWSTCRSHGPKQAESPAPGIILSGLTSSTSSRRHFRRA